MKNLDLSCYGIRGSMTVIHNPSYQELFKFESSIGNTGLEICRPTSFGAMAVNTGKFTGRAPKDRYVVRDSITSDTVWWDKNVNQPVDQQVWNHCKRLVTDNLCGADRLFVVDAFCGVNTDSRLKVRFITEVAWQAHFVTNMFIRPAVGELEGFGEPDFVVLNSSSVTNNEWQRQGLNSEVFVMFNISERIQIIGGTWYGGEMKKGIFSMMNYFLPLKGIASMHCSANMGSDGDVALFFGLSGTGKTTLSADPKRYLIGDDEHGWDERGVFNFEGGSYAKTFKLSPEQEPDIWRAIRRDSLLENVALDDDGNVDFADSSLTENGRVSYPIYFIDKIVLPSRAGHPDTIIYLSADAFGVLPPVSFLDSFQSKYYFLCGYTAKMSGTENGILEPKPSFSPAFGEAFLSLHPSVYANLLAQKIERHGTRVYLVNTGWNGSGKRISLKDTRLIIDSILSGTIDKSLRVRIPVMNLEIPASVDGVNPDILDPRNSYQSPLEWERRARDLASRFVNYFSRYADTAEGKELASHGPQVD